MKSTRRQPSWSFSLYLFTSAAVLSVAFLTTWKRKRYQNRANEDDKRSSPHRRRPSGRGFAASAASNHTNSRKQQHPLPSHLERELYKEERRKQMIPVLAMKKLMYDNIRMKDPTGKILCTVGSKKANWYVRKSLACWEEGNAAIRLNFEPKQKSKQRSSTLKADENANSSARARVDLRNDGNESFSQEQEQHRHLYNQSLKENKCVICGVDKDYRRHYIVPYCYRSRFPQRFKTHMPHDVVILCPDCHVTAQQISHGRMQELEDRLRGGKNYVLSAQPAWNDPVLTKVRSAACALLRRRDQLPDDKIREYTAVVRDYFHDTQQQKNAKDDCRLALTIEQLQQASQVEPRQPNPQYISGPDLVMQDISWKIRRRLSVGRSKAGSDRDVTIAVDDDNDVELRVLGDFVREWRSLFCQTMRPRCLPKGWSVDAPVICDEG